jgi:hypothetical protein
LEEGEFLMKYLFCWTIFVMMLYAVAPAAVDAYALTPSTHTDTGGAAGVEIIPPKDGSVEISDVDVYRDGNELTIKGSVIKHRPLFRTQKGHIDIAVVNPEGNTVATGTAEYRHIPSRHRKSDFSLTLSVPPTKGMEVCMTFHLKNGNGSTHRAAIAMLQAECG